MTKRGSKCDVRERELVAIIGLRDATEVLAQNMRIAFGVTARVMVYDGYILGMLERILMGRMIRGISLEQFLGDVVIPTELKKVIESELMRELNSEIDLVSQRIPAAEEYEIDVRGSVDAAIHTVRYMPLTDTRVVEMVRQQISENTDYENGHIPERMRRLMGV